MLDSRALGDKLFVAHQEWVKQQMKLDADGLDLDDEVFVLLKTVAELGISHALERQYELLGLGRQP